MKKQMNVRFCGRIQEMCIWIGGERKIKIGIMERIMEITTLRDRK
jgi:hypothetical protein